MLKTTLTAALLAAGALGLTACDVNKTQEGNVSVPKYEVEKTKEGNVTLPKYDVTPPSVQVGSADATVKVPNVDVKTEEKKVTVPTVKVTPAPDK